MGKRKTPGPFGCGGRWWVASCTDSDDRRAQANKEPSDDTDDENDTHDAFETSNAEQRGAGARGSGTCSHSGLAVSFLWFGEFVKSHNPGQGTNPAPGAG